MVQGYESERALLLMVVQLVHVVHVSELRIQYMLLKTSIKNAALICHGLCGHHGHSPLNQCFK